MEMDGKLLLGAFGACMLMCLAFAGGGVVIGTGLASIFSGQGSSIMFIAFLGLFILAAFLFFKSRKNNDCCKEGNYSLDNLPLKEQERK